ncbi:MAG: 3-hydroxybutyrate oligomer hydrolase family protein [Negativicutes bacterium]|nr:3-hydroxybutyrate oligomer hydrolase family protein [Negativicutes bacterium]
MRKWRTSLVVSVFIIYGLLVMPAVQAAMSGYIPGAHSVDVKAYDDLTTNNPVIGNLAEGGRLGLGPQDWNENGKPVRPAWYTPQTKVAGLEISGMFEDSKFVIRIPEKWNGKLVVGGSPGIGDERRVDALISDYVLTRFDANGASYAYAYSDKGTTGEAIPAPDGKIYPWAKAATSLLDPKDNLAEWHMRLHQLTVATKDLLKRTRGQVPTRTYVWGCSMGGYVTRYAIENDGDLYDGGVDWEGNLWRPEANILSTITVELQNYLVLNNPNATAQDKEKAIAALNQLGLPTESQIVWKNHYEIKMWTPWFHALRLKFDPGSTPYRNWWEYMDHPEDALNYDYASRIAIFNKTITPIQNTGNIKKPVISVFGTWDSQVLAKVNGLGYEKLVKENGKADIYRLYLVEHANHLDGIVGSPQWDKDKQLQPLLPYIHQAFNLLEDWVEKGVPAPASQTIAVPQTTGKVIDIKTGQEIDKY